MMSNQASYASSSPSSSSITLSSSSSSSFKLVHARNTNYETTDHSFIVSSFAEQQQPKCQSSPAVDEFNGGEHGSIGTFIVQQSGDHKDDQYQSSYAATQTADAARTWDLVVPTCAAAAISTTTNHHRQHNGNKYQSQPTRHKAEASDETASGEEAINEQKYYFHYQDEMSRMRERLFRLLSKVPIHVETEPISCSSNGSHPANTLATTSKQQQQHVKSIPRQSRVIDREPLIIKYYKDRTLSELIDQHFGCSLIKHNFEHKEPLLNEIANSSCSNQNVPCQLLETTNHQQRTWSSAHNQHSSSAMGITGRGPNQLVSWHHLDQSMWQAQQQQRSAELAKRPNRSRPQKRNGCLAASSLPPTKVERLDQQNQNYHQYTAQQAPNMNGQVTFLPLTSTAYNPTGSSGVVNEQTDLNAGYHLQPFIAATNNGDARFEQQPLMVGGCQTVADNATTDWCANNLGSQLLNDAQHYTDPYYPAAAHYAIQQQPQVIQAVDNWHCHPHQQVSLDEAQATSVHMIEQQQHPSSSETSNNYNCIDMINQPRTTTTTNAGAAAALYLPMPPAPNHGQAGLYSIGQHHQLIQAQDLQQQQIQYQPPIQHPTGQASCHMLPTSVATFIHEATS